MKAPVFCLVANAACCLLSQLAPADDKRDFIEVRGANVIPTDKIACERIPLGEVDDYKPSLALLPSGELLLIMFNGERLDGGKVRETTVIYRSADGGKTWAGPEVPEIPGREPSLTVLKDGTILVTSHLLAQEVRNKDGYVYSNLHRSTDGGRTWSTMRIEPKEFRPRTIGLTTRNVLQLLDGSVLLGISEHAPKCKSIMLRSTDSGKTWTETYEAKFEGVPKNYPYTLFGEAHLWQARSGKLYAILRVGARNSWPLEGTTDPGNSDQSERMIVYSSTDLGHTWSKVRDLGDYGQMYMSLLRLGSDRLLLTFTQRDIKPPLGVRAVLGTELDDGFEFNLTQDHLLLDTKTPIGVKSGGGFGPTVQLADGTLITAYTYRDSNNLKHAEVVRWRMPKLD